MPLNHSKIFHYPLFKFLNIQKVKLFKYLNKYSESTTQFKVWRSSDKMELVVCQRINFQLKPGLMDSPKINFLSAKRGTMSFREEEKRY